MIHVDRSRIAVPDSLSEEPGSPAQIERVQARRFFRLKQRRGQRRFPFKVHNSPDVKEALKNLFFNKCAYCESRLDRASPGDVEHFRPKGGVTEMPDHPGYWWLAASWNNLMLACTQCSRSRQFQGGRTGKADRFPLEDENSRAFSPGDESKEKPLLLDPCVDTPEEHLVFDEGGMVHSSTARGRTTISVLGLNRPQLARARMRAAADIRVIVDNAKSLERELRKQPGKFLTDVRLDAFRTELPRLTDAKEEYAGLKRQLLRPVLELVIGSTDAKNLTAAWEAPTPVITSKQRAKAKHSFQAFQYAQSDFSLKDEGGREKFRSQRRQIERISLKNVKAIADLDLELADTVAGRTGWLMLLGENGTGKSTVLQAIALALSGADYFATLARKRELAPADFLRFGQASAKVSIKLSGFLGPHELTLGKMGARFRKPTGETALVTFKAGKARVVGGTTKSKETQSVVLGYGATRLLPRRKGERYGIEFARVDNLFDPFLPLFDADQWLTRLERRNFDRVAIVLKDLLALAEEAKLTRENRRIMVRTHGAKVPLKQLSDGYQAVIAMSIDILEVVMRLWPRLQDAEGIILLDEIGSQLHPTWKMRIVESLRRAFPGMQFIATTHDPLCLRGLGEGEVVVMRRNESHQIVAVTGLPSPGDFRVDQLLTSEFFGLNSTSDPEVEKIFDEYYALLALKPRSSEQEQRLGSLQEQLKDRRYLGNTLREQLMYEAIDQLVARHKSERKSIPQLKREAVEEISRIWNEKL